MDPTSSRSQHSKTSMKGSLVLTVKNSTKLRRKDTGLLLLMETMTLTLKVTSSSFPTFCLEKLYMVQENTFLAALIIAIWLKNTRLSMTMFEDEHCKII